MFKRKTCPVCAEKEKVIELLKEQNKDLLNRLMAFNKDAFVSYQAEIKVGEPLLPHAIDEKGEKIEYKNLDLAKVEQEIFSAFGEEPVEVEK